MKEIKKINKNLRYFLWTLFGIIFLGGFVFATTTITDTGIISPFLNSTGNIFSTGNVSADYIKANVDWTNLTNYPVACPANSYLTQLDDSVTCTEVVDIPNGGDVTFNEIYNVSKINEVLYVQANNGSDIQVKIDMCPSSGCKVVIPSGNYNISSVILIPNNTFLEGYGFATKLFFNSGTNSDIIQNLNRTFGNNNIIIKNLFIDGNSAGQTSTSSCINLKNITNLILENLILNDCANFSITIDNSNKIVVQSNFIDASSNAGIQFINGGKKLYISNNFINNTIESGISMADTQTDVSIVNNKIFNTFEGITGYNQLINKIIAQGNIIKTTSNHGIHLAGNNIFIENNYVEGTTFDGIRLSTNTNQYGESFSISNNIVINSGRHGIEVSNMTSGSIIGNVINKTTDLGILIEGNSKKINVIGNSLNLITNGAFRLVDSQDIIIQSNNVYDSGRAVRITGNEDRTIISNNIFKNIQNNGIITRNQANNTFIVNNLFLNVTEEINLGINDTSPYQIQRSGIKISGNLTLTDKITFALSETIDNLVDGWIRITGGLNVTQNLEVGGNITSNNAYFGSLDLDNGVPLFLYRNTSSDSIMLHVQNNRVGGRADIGFYNESGGKIAYIGSHNNDTDSTASHFHIKTINSTGSMLTRLGIDTGDNANVTLLNANFKVNDNTIDAVGRLCIDGFCGSSTIELDDNTIRIDSGVSGGTANLRFDEVNDDKWRIYLNGTDDSLLIDETAGTDNNIVKFLNSGMMIISQNKSTVTCSASNEGGIYYDGSTKKHYGCNSTDWNALY